jgi:lipoprotein-anchoring transpeptidase ErfK/SrfK
MHSFTRKCYSVVLHVLLLMMLLTVSVLALHANAHAQVARTTAASSVSLKRDESKMIVVSLSQQWLYAYANGVQVFSTAVMTGRPSLPTPTGTYTVFAKLHPTTFYSPFPKGSPDWYPPTYINYALEWQSGYFLHDSWWHTVYGPGTNGWHYDPVYGWQWGSHGCVAMALSSAAWLYDWAPIGTTVQINP